jgi:REP element-mobilizing transposase RayT
MARLPRGEVLEQTDVGVYHCINRCVRRAYLCGQDFVTGKNYDYRKEYVRRRLEFLAGRFGLDVLSYTVMSNHLHVILRNRPDVVADWSDEEVARRWWELFPTRRDKDGSLVEPNVTELQMITSDPEKLAERRRRLSDVSWFMRCLCEPIARLANKEDECTGRFWEGRFKCQRLLDESALLACSVYVDLNPVRAKIAMTPEASDYTSAQDRIKGEQQRQQTPLASSPEKPSLATTGSSDVVPRRSSKKQQTPRDAIEPDGWLSPVELAKELPVSEKSASPDGKTRPRTARTSDKGFLPMSLSQYLKLLDWTGRQTRRGKPGTIPSELNPILARIGVSSDTWVETVLNFGRWFRRAAGRAQSLADEASRRGQHWLHGVSHSRQAFG